MRKPYRVEDTVESIPHITWISKLNKDGAEKKLKKNLNKLKKNMPFFKNMHYTNGVRYSACKNYYIGACSLHDMNGVQTKGGNVNSVGSRCGSVETCRNAERSEADVRKSA